MTRTLRIEPPVDGRSYPEIPGVKRDSGEWELQLDYYDTLILEITGIDVGSGVSNTDIKVIQNRLEGCVENYKRENSCLCDEFDRYEHVDSIDTVQELARFFRTVVADRIERAHAEHRTKSN